MSQFHPYQQVPPHPYAGQPAGGPAPASTGLNPWGAAALGAVAGMVLSALVGVMLWVVMGGPLPWEGIEDLADDWSGRVEVAGDGSASGQALSRAVMDVGGGGFYEQIDCADTPQVMADVMTLCRVDDGYDQYRVVVLFLDDDGRFETAEVYSQD